MLYQFGVAPHSTGDVSDQLYDITVDADVAVICTQ